MDLVCPLCNGLKSVTAVCSCCGGEYEDIGLVSDYVGPYSPYTLSVMVRDENRCLHVFKCRECGDQSYAFIENVVI